MESKSYGITIRFENTIRRFLFVTEQLKSSDSKWEKATNELDELAEMTKNSGLFWQSVIRLFNKYGFNQIRE